jgi:hypothetical protein
MLNAAMPKVGLQSSRVMAGIGQGEATSTAQHVRMRFEIEPGSIASTLDHLGEAGS